MALIQLLITLLLTLFLTVSPGKTKEEDEKAKGLLTCFHCKRKHIPATAEVCPRCGADLAGKEEEKQLTCPRCREPGALPDDMYCFNHKPPIKLVDPSIPWQSRVDPQREQAIDSMFFICTLPADVPLYAYDNRVVAAHTMRALERCQYAANELMTKEDWFEELYEIPRVDKYSALVWYSLTGAPYVYHRTRMMMPPEQSIRAIRTWFILEAYQRKYLLLNEENTATLRYSPEVLDYYEHTKGMTPAMLHACVFNYDLVKGKGGERGADWSMVIAQERNYVQHLCDAWHTLAQETQFTLTCGVCRGEKRAYSGHSHLCEECEGKGVFHIHRTSSGFAVEQSNVRTSSSAQPEQPLYCTHCREAIVRKNANICRHCGYPVVRTYIKKQGGWNWGDASFWTHCYSCGTKNYYLPKVPGSEPLYCECCRSSLKLPVASLKELFHCPNCGSWFLPSVCKYCHNCGEPLDAIQAEEPVIPAPVKATPPVSRYCPYCGKPTVANAKHCMHCTAPLIRSWLLHDDLWETMQQQKRVIMKINQYSYACETDGYCHSCGQEVYTLSRIATVYCELCATPLAPPEFLQYERLGCHNCAKPVYPAVQHYCRFCGVAVPQREQTVLGGRFVEGTITLLRDCSWCGAKGYPPDATRCTVKGCGAWLPPLPVQ